MDLKKKGYVWLNTSDNCPAFLANPIKPIKMNYL